MKSKVGKVFGNIAMGIITVGVLLFLGSHSLSFFQFTFSTQDQVYAWLGLLLTSGGAIGWLIVFMSTADTPLRKVISMIMCVVGGLGEMATAVFDMQYSAMYSTGFQFQPQELKNMTTIIGFLGLITGLALAAYAAGDKVVEAFGDQDGDGIPNYRDRDYKPKQNSSSNNQSKPKQKQPQQPQAQQHSLDELLRVAGMTKDQARAQYADRDEFMRFASGQFAYISGGNMKRIYAELMNGHQPQAVRNP